VGGRARRPSLAGRVVVVDVAARDAARALGADGAAVVVVGVDAGGVGTLVRELTDAGGRAVALVGSLGDDADRATLAELVAELFDLPAEPA
jgi:hypothetical protein